MSGCGKPLSAECVAIDNPQFKSIPNRVCGDGAGEVMRQLDKATKALQDITNVSGIQGQALGIDNRTATLLSVIQVLIAQVSKLKEDLAVLKQEQRDYSLLNVPISIDGSCLSLPNCTDGSTYTLGQVLSALVSKSCGGSASATVYQPAERY